MKSKSINKLNKSTNNPIKLNISYLSNLENKLNTRNSHIRSNLSKEYDTNSKNIRKASLELCNNTGVNKTYYINTKNSINLEAEIKPTQESHSIKKNFRNNSMIISDFLLTSNPEFRPSTGTNKGALNSTFSKFCKNFYKF